MTSNPLEDPCDYVLFAGKRTPGIAEITGAGSPREWEERKGLGMSGAICVFQGRKLARFSVKIRLTTVQDWNDWHAFAPLVLKFPKRRTYGGERRDSGMLDVAHPYLQMLGINAACIEDVLQPDQTDHGEYTIEIKCLEFRQPVFTLAKPAGAAATPVDPIEEEIIKPLMSQFEELAAE